jgi:hypothetical protein
MRWLLDHKIAGSNPAALGFLEMTQHTFQVFVMAGEKQGPKVHTYICYMISIVHLFFSTSICSIIHKTGLGSCHF